MYRILGREGASTRVSGMLFKVVVQAVMIFWGGYVGDHPPHRPGPGGSQHRVTQRITSRQPQWLLDRSRDYPPLETVIQESVF